MKAVVPLVTHIPLQISIGEVCWFLWRWSYGTSYRFQIENLILWAMIGLIGLLILSVYVLKKCHAWPQIPAFFAVLSITALTLDSASKGNLGPSFLQNEACLICALVLALTLTSLWLDRERFSVTESGA